MINLMSPAIRLCLSALTLLAVARARGSFSTAVYLFSHDGVLIGAAIDNREQDLGLGFSIGSKKADAADEAAFLVPSTQHRWGLSALGRLPKTLNAANDLDSGNIGFEQRNVPIDVGQRSLESGYATVETLLQAMKRGTIN